MTDAPVESNALLNHDDKSWTEQAIAQKSDSKKKMIIGIVVILLLLGAVGVIIGVAISQDNDDDDVDVDNYYTEEFTYSAKV